MKVPSPRTAARRMCAADVPTAFPRSAADWRTGRGADSIRMSPRAADARSAGGAAEIRFKAATWQTFLEAIRSTRLAHAEDLLSRKGEGKRDIIANECGYAAWSSVHRLIDQRKSEARDAYHRASEQRAAAQRILT